MSDMVDTNRRLSRGQWRLIWLASLGGSLEFYDFIIYGIFAQYISKQFFPASDPFISLILTLSVLALGYFARPVGGIIIGWFGDRFGRRPVFMTSIGLTTIATILIGLLPNYSQWGLAAPLLLVVLRLAQGMCLGGELPGALVYAIEAAPKRAGLACGLIIFCVNSGVMVATFVNLVLQHVLSPAGFVEHGWRFAFLLGGLIGAISFLLRRKLEESPEFVKLHANVERHPLREVIRHHSREMLLAAGIAAVIAGFNGVLFGYMTAYLGQLHYQPGEVATAMTIALLVGSVGLIIAGWAGDYIPGRLILRVGAGLLTIAIWPLLKLIATHRGDMTLLLVLMSAIFSISSGIWPSLIASQFPTRVRFSGIAVAYNITTTLLSGFAPLAAATLIEKTGDPASPALYIAATAAISFIASFFIRAPRRATRAVLAPS